MNKFEENTEWVDRYLRNELMVDEEAAFEAALLESSELQSQLEPALGIRQTLQFAEEVDMAAKAHSLPVMDARNNWQPTALAASVLLATFSTAMYWKVSNEAGVLQSEIESMNLPRTAVLTVPLDIMRSASDVTPDMVIQKPDDNTLVILNVELSPAVIALGHVQVALRDTQEVELQAWDSGSFEQGRVTAAFDSRNLPDGRVWLEMSDQQGEVLDRRLIEFLP